MGADEPLLNRIIYAFRCRPVALIAIATVIVTFILGLRNIETSYQSGDYCHLTGTIRSVSRKPYGEGYILSVVCSKVTDDNHTVLGRAGATVTSYFPEETPVKIGQTIAFSGKVQLYESATNPGQFDYYRYNCKKNNLFLVKDAKLESAGSKYNHLTDTLYRIRVRGEELLAGLLNPVDSAIMKAMLFGNKSEIDEDIRDSFQRNGIAHILAISGLHISFMGMGLYKLLKYIHIPIPISIIISETFILLYGMMVGMGTSASRAICMFSTFLLSGIVLRSYDMLTAMSFSLIILLVSNRGNLWDIGFLLSFMAILGISFFAGCFRKYVWNYPDKLSAAFASAFITLATLPIILSSFYQVAWYTVLLNLLIIPLMSVLLTAAIFMLLIQSLIICMSSVPLFTEALGVILRADTFVVTGILRIYKFTCSFLERLRLGRGNLGAPNTWQVIIYYVLLTAVCVGIPAKLYNIMSTKMKAFNIHPLRSARTVPSILLSMILLAVDITFLANHYHTGVDIYMLDVGQGDSMAIRTDDNHWYLIDGGSSDVRKVGENRIIPFFQYMGVDDIEGIILTHPDADHINGVEEIVDSSLIENLRIHNIVAFSGFDDGEDGWRGLLSKAKEQGVTTHYVSAGDRISDGKLIIEVLGPDRNVSTADVNDASLVLRITYGRISMITTGDMSTSGEERLLRQQVLERVSILKVAHHGSDSSSSSSFLEAISPQIALISAPIHSRYGHPHESVIKRLEEIGTNIYCTKDYGAVKIHIDGEKLQIFSYK